MGSTWSSVKLVIASQQPRRPSPPLNGYDGSRRLTAPRRHVHFDDELAQLAVVEVGRSRRCDVALTPAPINLSTFLKALPNAVVLATALDQLKLLIVISFITGKYFKSDSSTSNAFPWVMTRFFSIFLSRCIFDWSRVWFRCKFIFLGSAEWWWDLLRTESVEEDLHAFRGRFDVDDGAGRLRLERRRVAVRLVPKTRYELRIPENKDQFERLDPS